MNSITDVLAESYRPRAIAGQNCLICGMEGPFALHLIEATFPDFGASDGPLKKLGPFVPQSASRGQIHGGFVICSGCAPECQKCGLPIRTKIVEKVYRLLSIKIPQGCSVALGNGFCRHSNFFLRQFHRPKDLKFLNPFEMFQVIQAMNAAFRPVAKPPKPIASAPSKTPSADYNVGDAILGRYKIERILSGGMGKVFVVNNGGERLVLKTYFGDQENHSLFKSECRNWISLGHHPNIVQARWVDNIGSMLCVAATYVPPDSLGRTSLADHMRFGGINIEQMIRWACEFCYAMEHAMAHGLLVHRDVKPANILIDASGSFLLTDFGISLSRDEVRPTGAVGTVPYMPPEQWRGGSAGFASDVYAFGIVLFQLAFGRFPFEADSVADWQLQHEAQKVVPAHPLSSIIQCSLSSNSNERFNTPAELLLAVSNVADMMKIPMPPKPDVIDDEQDELLGLASLHAVGGFDSAFDAAKKLTRLYPQFAAGWTQLGRLLLENGHVEDAARACQKALLIDSTRSAPWNNLAMCFGRLGASKQAIEAFEAAIRWDPQNAGAMSNLAGELSQGSTDAAIHWGRRAVEIAPENWKYWVNLGSVLRLARQEQEARAAFQRALDLAPVAAQDRIRSVAGIT